MSTHRPTDLSHLRAPEAKALRPDVPKLDDEVWRVELTVDGAREELLAIDGEDAVWMWSQAAIFWIPASSVASAAALRAWTKHLHARVAELEAERELADQASAVLVRIADREVRAVDTLLAENERLTRERNANLQALRVAAEEANAARAENERLRAAVADRDAIIVNLRFSADHAVKLLAEAEQERDAHRAAVEKARGHLVAARGPVAVLREAWPNDGAEGESVHRTCGLIESAIAALSRASAPAAAASSLHADPCTADPPWAGETMAVTDGEERGS